MVYISCMEHNDRFQQLELKCAELIQRLDEYEANLQAKAQRLSHLEARLDKIVALLGIEQDVLDHKTNFWDYPSILRWHLESRNN